MLQHSNFPTRHGEVKIELEPDEDNSHVGFVNRPYYVYGDRLELIESGVFLYDGDKLITNLHIEGHIARRLCIDAEHAGVDVRGI